MPRPDAVSLATFRHYTTIGALVLQPDDFNILVQATNALAPRSNKPPEVLLSLMVAGAVTSKVTTAIEAIIRAAHPADAEGEPEIPEWAAKILEALGLTTEPPKEPTGPVESVEELHTRAAAAGLVIP